MLTAWGTGTGLYPYLNWQFAAGTTPQSISGIAYQANGTALAGATLPRTLNGTAFAGTGTGANGYYYFLLPQGSTARAAAFSSTSPATDKANSYVQGAAGSVQNFNLERRHAEYRHRCHRAVVRRLKPCERCRRHTDDRSLIHDARRRADAKRGHQRFDRRLGRIQRRPESRSCRTLCC